MTTTCLSQKLLVLLPVLVLLLCEASRIQQGITQECSVDEDCRTVINGSICNSTTGNCMCPEIKPILVRVEEQNSSYCLIGFNATGGNCTFSDQCKYDEGTCIQNRVCGCNLSFKETEDGSCAPLEKSAIIPIAVGVGIGVSVFGTLCLYFWLSRTKEEVDK